MLSRNEDQTARHRLLFWLGAAGLLCLFPLFFVGGPGWSDGPLLIAVWNLGHPIFFGLLTLTVRPWRFLSGWRLWLLSSVVVLLLGTGVEFAQSLNNRDVDPRDIFRNMTGVWIVLALQPRAGFPNRSTAQGWLLRIMAAGLLAIDLVTVSRIAIQQIQISQWLPDLYDFQHEQPEDFWRGNVARTSGKECGSIEGHALSIELSTRHYSGASLDNLPSDWQGYDELSIVLWNPENRTIPLTIRINDLAHEKGANSFYDRFNRTFRITPGLNRIRQDLDAVASAPADRQMNMAGVRRLIFFTSDLDQPGRLCLSSLRLVKRGDASNGLN